MFALPDWPAWAFRSFVGLISLVSCVAIGQTIMLKGDCSKESKENPSGSKLPAFRAFQRQYLVVYYIIMLADWLQGTNMYTLYQSYGVDISGLFCTGFAASSIFGTIVGLYVDQWGRKLGCIIYLVLEVIINVFEHFNNFPLLIAGRILGGISTSLLFSAFESWMVTEHRKRGFPEGWLADTFGKGSFGNGLIAITAGILAQLCADRLGEIGPFQLAIAFTVLALFFVLFWTENYGGEDVGAGKEKEKEEEVPAWRLILSDRKMMLYGLSNSLFDGAMFSFVFMWVPTMFGVLQGAPLPTGLVFSSLMACISLGGVLFTIMGHFVSVEYGMVGIFAMGALALSVPVVAKDLPSVLCSFFVFETCVGLMGPAAGVMRSKVIPDAVQGSVMNLFRVPLNILVVVGTKLTDLYPANFCFSMIVAWLLAGATLQFILAVELGKPAKSRKNGEHKNGKEE